MSEPNKKSNTKHQKQTNYKQDSNTKSQIGPFLQWFHRNYCFGVGLFNNECSIAHAFGVNVCWGVVYSSQNKLPPSLKLVWWITPATSSEAAGCFFPHLHWMTYGWSGTILTLHFMVEAPRPVLRWNGEKERLINVVIWLTFVLPAIISAVLLDHLHASEWT